MQTTRVSESGAWGYRGGGGNLEKGVDCTVIWLLVASRKLSDCRISGLMNKLVYWDTVYWLEDAWEWDIIDIRLGKNNRIIRFTSRSLIGNSAIK